MFTIVLPLSSLPPPRQPRVAAPQVPATAQSRSLARKTLRPYPVRQDTSFKNCQASNLSWLAQRYVLLGLHHAGLPSDLDLHTPRVGRVFNYTVQKIIEDGTNQEFSVPLALFPVSPSYAFVPPYPGVPPQDFNAPNSSRSSYIDGTRGCWDPRRYPQIFDSRRPWLPFHRNLESFAWDSANCDVLSPCEYFVWAERGIPGRGGHWSLKRLAVLFSKRETIEAQFLQLVATSSELAQIPFSNPSLRGSAYDLPWFDPLEWEDVLQWTTWTDGRDLLAYSTQYTAELQALNAWLSAQLFLTQTNFNQYPPPNEAFMGAWTPTLTRKEDWDFFLKSGIPLYVITRLPSTHPSLQGIKEGNLDGDERYRRDTFEADHCLEPFFYMPSPGKHIFPNIPDLRLECRPDYVPSIFNSVSPLCPPRHVTTSYLLGWRSSIYSDPSVSRLNADLYVLQREVLHSRLALIDSLAFNPSNLQILKPESERHPLLDVIGHSYSRNGTLERYQEIYDEELGAYYPRRLGRRTTASKSQRDRATYCWTYPDLRIQIFSDHKFPGRLPSYGMVDQEEDCDQDDVKYNPRKEDERFYWELDSRTGKPVKELNRFRNKNVVLTNMFSYAPQWLVLQHSAYQASVLYHWTLDSFHCFVRPMLI
jgi:hypothetical protein